MTETEAFNVMKKDPESETTTLAATDAPKRGNRSRWCCVASVILIVFLTIFLICLILALTVFKAKDPKTTVESIALEGVAPRVSFPAIKIDINITLNINVSVYNPNHASFKHGPGKSELLYRGNKVGDVDVASGNIPSKDSELIKCRLVLDADEIGSDLSGLISDVLAGEVVVETNTRIPGRVKILGFIKKHAVATSNCQITIDISGLKVKNQVCHNKTKF